MNVLNLKIQPRPPGSLLGNNRHARRHAKKQIGQIAESIERFGFNVPILITPDGEIIAGHARWQAAKLLGLEQVPTILIGHLTDEERRAFIIADNKLALNATWDQEVLALELGALIDLGFDATLTGFDTAEIDLLLDTARNSDPDDNVGTEDIIPAVAGTAVTRRGDMWQLGRHILLCGDARKREDHQRVLFEERADLLFTDPPYGCRVGDIIGLGKIKHREFAMASGEMSEEEFIAFLEASLGAAAACCKDGAIAFVFMNWRSAGALMQAGRKVFTKQKNLCVWNKSNGGMGSFYRSKHELIFVYKVGTAPHTNNFGLGQNRYRTNVWDYPGISSISKGRREEQERHPTPKPVALVADAILDCSKRGEIVLDPFAGSGSTLIAAESCGRAARLIEYDPLYCDVIIRRYEQYLGKDALLMGPGTTFEEVTEQRAADLQGKAA